MHAPPRLSIGVIEDDSDTSGLGAALEGVGHRVSYLDSPEDAADFELVVLAVAENLVDPLVEQLSARARSGQIYLHTAPGRGAQALDALETSGAVVAALARIDGAHWAVTALDELGFTIAELLVTEIGARAIDVPETQRTRLGAALMMQRLHEGLKQETLTLLVESLGDPKAASSVVGQVCGGPLLEQPETLERYVQAIEEPGTARLFKDLVRRYAEVTGAHDVELWAMG